jgi:uncharacterized protein YegL
MIMNVCFLVLTVFMVAAVTLRPAVSGYARRKKRLFVLMDLSPSMEVPPTKINAANDAMRSSLAKLKQKSLGQERSDVELSVIGFSDRAWPIKSGPVQSLEWEHVPVTGSGTRIGAALQEVAKEFVAMQNQRDVRYGQSVVILVTDGQPRDDWQAELREMLASEVGAKCLRLGIGVGDDADLNMLHEFMGLDPLRLPLLAKNAEEIVRHIEFGTTVLPFLGRDGGLGDPLLPPTDPPSADDFPTLMI